MYKDKINVKIRRSFLIDIINTHKMPASIDIWTRVNTSIWQVYRNFSPTRVTTFPIRNSKLCHKVVNV